MLVVWIRAIYGRVQSTERLLRQVLRAAATQRQRSPLQRQKKRGKTVKFNGTTKNVDSMKAHDAPIPRKMKVKIRHRSLRVTSKLQFQNIRNVFVGLAA